MNHSGKKVRRVSCAGLHQELNLLFLLAKGRVRDCITQKVHRRRVADRVEPLPKAHVGIGDHDAGKNIVRTKGSEIFCMAKCSR